MSRAARPLATALIAVLAAAPTGASPPSPGNSTTPACITLVGSDGTNASAMGTFTVIYRDLANNPIPNAQVVVDVSNANDIHLCAQQLAPGITMDCPGRKAAALTDANGSVTFTLLGGSNGAGNASSLLGAARLYANGTLIASPTVSVFDLDGSAGVGANDLSAWLSDFGTGVPFGRSDYDCSNGVGANDLSIWLVAYGAGTQIASCAASCP